MIIKGTKDESKMLRWLKRAASAKDRPLLCGIRVDNSNVVAADGYRMHIAPTPACLEPCQGKLVNGKVPAGEFTVVVDATDGPYPDYMQILPKGSLEFAIAVNPKYLIDALKGMGEQAILCFYGPHDPMEVRGQDRYALIMPLHLENLADKGWRPLRHDPEMRKRIERKLAEAELALANEKLAYAEDGV